MTNEEIIEKIRTTLAEEFEIDVEQIQPDAPLQPKILPVSKPSRISIIW